MFADLSAAESHTFLIIFLSYTLVRTVQPYPPTFYTQCPSYQSKMQMKYIVHNVLFLLFYSWYLNT